MSSSALKTWSSSRGDLHLDLEPGAGLGTRPRQRLERSLRDAIRAGRLPAGTRLPSTRALAGDLGIARGTVVEAYAQLAAEGWIAARPRSGAVVTGAGGTPGPGPGLGLGVGSGAADGGGGAEPGPLLDLRPGNNDVRTFPRSAWIAAVRRALSVAPHEAFAYGDPRGWPDLRRELSSYLARTRGVRADPAHLVITTGFTQSLSLTARAFAATGRTRLAMEDPCVPSHRRVAAAAGQRVVPVPVDAAGVDVAAIRAGGAALRAALVAPARQFPLGVSLGPDRRGELLAWANDRDGYVVEDDYDGEFRYDRQPVGALQGLDPARVVYAGTTSKTLAPGVRLGWLAVPDHLLEAVVEQKRFADRQTTIVNQLALTELLRGGGYDRHVRRMRQHYRRRRDDLLRELARRAPHVRVAGIAAGFNVAVTLPDGWTEGEIVARAAARGLAVHALSEGGYYAEGPGNARPARPARLVIDYARPSDHAYPAAVAALVEALARRA